MALVYLCPESRGTLFSPQFSMGVPRYLSLALGGGGAPKFVTRVSGCSEICNGKTTIFILPCTLLVNSPLNGNGITIEFFNKIREHQMFILQGSIFHVWKFHPPKFSPQKTFPLNIFKKKHIKWSNSHKKWIKWLKKFYPPKKLF